MEQLHLGADQTSSTHVIGLQLDQSLNKERFVDNKWDWYRLTNHAFECPGIQLTFSLDLKF